MLGFRFLICRTNRAACWSPLGSPTEKKIVEGIRATRFPWYSISCRTNQTPSDWRSSDSVRLSCRGFTMAGVDACGIVDKRLARNLGHPWLHHRYPIGLDPLDVDSAFLVRFWGLRACRSLLLETRAKRPDAITREDRPMTSTRVRC